MVLLDEIALAVVFGGEAFIVVEKPGGLASGGLSDALTVGVVAVLANGAAVDFDFGQSLFVVVEVVRGLAIVRFLHGVAIGIVAEAGALDKKWVF